MRKMRLVKKWGICILSMVLLVMSIRFDVSAAAFDDVNSDSMFFKQSTSYTCTLASAAMMVRRAALLNGNSNWSSVTENNMKNAAWSGGLKNSFSYAGISVSAQGGTSNLSAVWNKSSSQKAELFRSLLEQHPEGIVMYCKKSHNINAYVHAILLTDYTDGSFYCSDPASNAPRGRIPLSSATVNMDNAFKYWYVSSPKLALSESNSQSSVFNSTPVDLGTDFYAYIINTFAWKHLTNDGCNVSMRSETGASNQIWKFERQGDCSYKIINYQDNLVLDDQNFGQTNGTNVAVCGNNDSDAQRWFVYGSSGEYYLRAKCGNLVLDINCASTEDGANVQMWTKNDSVAQKFQIWKLNQPGKTNVYCSVGSGYKDTTFSWDKASNASTYDLKIWKDQLWQGDAYKILWDLTGNSAQVSLPPGYYEAYVDSRNGALINMSNNVLKFTVPEGSPENITIEKPTDSEKECQHQFGSWIVIKKATSTTDGTEQRTCKLCGKTETRTIKATADKNTDKDGASTPTGKKPLYCMIFDVNNGNPLENNYKYIYSGNALGTLPVPSRENYVFKGWYLQKTGGLRVSEKTIANSNARLYARWERVIVPKISRLYVWSESSAEAEVAYGGGSGANGYEILYSTDKKFKRNTLMVTTSDTSKTFTGLSKGKTYYFKVRMYKLDSTGKKIYGKYSAVKKAKIRK